MRNCQTISEYTAFAENFGWAAMVEEAKNEEQDFRKRATWMKQGSRHCPLLLSFGAVRVDKDNWR